MAGISAIDRLGAEVKSLVYSWFDDGQTVDQVLAGLHRMGHKIGRSAVGRKRLEWEKITAEVRQSRMWAEMMVRSFKDSPASELAAANVEILQTLMQRLLRSTMLQDDGTFNADEFMKLARASSLLGAARKTELDTTITAETVKQESAANGEATSGVIEVRLVEPEPRIEDSAAEFTAQADAESTPEKADGGE